MSQTDRPAQRKIHSLGSFLLYFSVEYFIFSVKCHGLQFLYIQTQKRTEWSAKCGRTSLSLLALLATIKVGMWKVHRKYGERVESWMENHLFHLSSIVHTQTHTHIHKDRIDFKIVLEPTTTITTTTTTMAKKSNSRGYDEAEVSLQDLHIIPVQSTVCNFSSILAFVLVITALIHYWCWPFWIIFFSLLFLHIL